MGFSISTNSLTEGALRNLENVGDKLATTIKRLSSGSRIASASDDPAGLAIADSMNATIRSMGQAVRNAQDGMSLVQVYEGGTNEVNNALIRIRELAMQASSDTVGDKERAMLSNEASELVSEITRIAKTTQYGGRSLLDGTSINLEFQVGVNNDPEKDRIVFAPGNTNLTADGLGIGSVDISQKDGARDSLELLDNAISSVGQIRSKIGSTESRLHTTISSQQIYMENVDAARSRIWDADIAHESAELTKNTILRKAGVAVLAQANETPALALQLLRT